MFYERFIKLCEQKNVKPTPLMKELGFSTGLPSQWKKTGQQPSYEKLCALARYFGVSVDYLAGNTPYKMPDTSPADPNAAYKMPDSAVKLGLDSSKPLKAQNSKMPDFIKRVGELSEDELDELDTFLDFIKARKAKKAATQGG